MRVTRTKDVAELIKEFNKGSGEFHGIPQSFHHREEPDLEFSFLHDASAVGGYVDGVRGDRVSKDPVRGVVEDERGGGFG